MTLIMKKKVFLHYDNQSDSLLVLNLGRVFYNTWGKLENINITSSAGLNWPCLLDSKADFFACYILLDKFWLFLNNSFQAKMSYLETGTQRLHKPLSPSKPISQGPSLMRNHAAANCLWAHLKAPVFFITTSLWFPHHLQNPNPSSPNMPVYK